MDELKTIPPEVAAIIPAVQLKISKRYLRDYSDGILLLKARLDICPKLYQTEGMKEHPAIFHYFYGSTDLYICEYDREDLLFGFSILNGDLYNSEWGFTSLSEIRRIPQFNIDYHFEEQSIEAALHTAYPDYFKKPPSLTE